MVMINNEQRLYSRLRYLNISIFIIIYIFSRLQTSPISSLLLITTGSHTCACLLLCLILLLLVAAADNTLPLLEAVAERMLLHGGSTRTRPW